MTYDNSASANGDDDGEAFRAGLKAAAAKVGAARRGNGSTSPSAASNVFPFPDAALRAEFSLFDNQAGPIGKEYRLTEQGELDKISHPDPSRGQYERLSAATIEEVMAHHAYFSRLPSCFFTQGVAKNTNAEHFTTKAKRALGSDVIARCKEDLIFPENAPGAPYIDFDLYKYKNVPKAWRDLDAIICEAWPELGKVRRVWYPGNSAFLYRESDGYELRGAGSWRLRFLVDNAAAIPRFIEYLFQRLWAMGYGWIEPAKDGKPLIRTLIDGSTGRPDLPDFLAPILKPGCGVVRRLPEAFPQYRGEKRMLACADLPEAEPMAVWRKSNPRVLEAKKAAKPACDAAAAKNVEDRLPEFRAANPGVPDEELRRTIRAASAGRVLGLGFVVYEPGRSPMTVRSLLSLLEFTGEPIDLLDPVEPTYDGARAVAQAYLNAGGTAYIHSFAHGGGDGSRVFDLTQALKELQVSEANKSIMALPAPAFNEQAAPEAPAPRFNADGTINTAAPYSVPPFRQPLPVTLLPVAPFEIDLLPVPLQGWAADTVERMQCPADFIGAALMVALGSVIGAKIVIRPKQHDDTWSEAANNYGGLIGQPSSKKSPAMGAVMSFVNKLEAIGAARHKEQLRLYRAKRELTDARIAGARKGAIKRVQDPLSSNLTLDEQALAYADELKLGEEEEPSPRRYAANDINPASLGEILRKNPEGTCTLVARDELQGLLQAFEREDTAALRPLFLEGWKGLNFHRIDRVQRGYIPIPTLCISIFGTIQPGVIAPHIRAAQDEGRGADGFLQRFQFLVWPDLSKTYKQIDRKADRTLEAKAFKLFEMLDRLTPADCGAQRDEPEGRPYLRFCLEAQAVFDAWLKNLETAMRGRDDLSALDSHVCKYPALVSSVALICHLAEGGKGPVSKAALNKALRWAAYLETHARRIYGSGPMAVTLAAKAIIKLAEDGKLPKPSFKARDIYRKERAQISKRAIVEEALDLLEDYGWAGSGPDPNQVIGRKTTIYWMREA